MGVGTRILFVAAAAAFAVLDAPQGFAQESRAETRDVGPKAKPFGTAGSVPKRSEDAGVLTWEPDRKLRGREEYSVRFLRADIDATDSASSSWGIHGRGHAETFDGIGGKYFSRFLSDVPPGVPYRALLSDRYGPIPGAVVEVPPLTAGEFRTVLVPLPKELGHARVRVVPVGERSAVGHKVHLVLATSDEPGRFRIPFDLNAHYFSVLRDGRASIRNERLATFWATVACPEIGWGAVRVTLAPRDVPVEETLVLKPTRRLALAFRSRTGIVLDYDVEAVFGVRGEEVPFGQSSRRLGFAVADSRPTADVVSDDRLGEQCWICPAEAIRLRVLIGGRAMDFEVPECAAFAEDARTFVVDGVGELVVRFTGDERAHDRRYKLKPIDVVGLAVGAGPDAVASVREVVGAVCVEPQVFGICGAAPRRTFRMRADRHRFAVWPGRWRIHGLEVRRIDVDVKPDVVTEIVVP